MGSAHAFLALDDQPVTVSTASSADADAWDAFVRSQRDATGYHEWGWRAVFQRAFGHQTIYLVARARGAICGVLPLVQINSLLFGRSLTSLPFVNYGGVIAEDGRVAQALLEQAALLARERRCAHVELRHLARRFPALPCRQHKVAMTLPLNGLRWETLDKKVRNQIRKAEKSDLTSETGGGELISDFYAVFARNMRDLGTPVYSRALFDEVCRAFPRRVRIHVVRYHGVAVAAGVTFTTRTRMEIPWASSIRDYNHLCPNTLLYWHVLQSAMDRGCELFDLGRSTPGEGTFKFKEQWGARAVPLYWEYALASGAEPPNTSPDNPKYAAAIEIWKRLPLPIATRIGPRIVRGIP